MNKNFNTTPAFRLIFSTVVGFTLLSGAASFWLGSQLTLSEYQIRNLEDSRSTWQMGIGVIFGLLGGKATELFQSEERESEE